jgi:hypothetical protein
MKLSGRMDVVSLVGIDFVGGGKSLRLVVVDSLPPHDTTFLTFKNAFSVLLHQSRDDGFPFILCELTWRTVEPEERRSIMADISYRFINKNEDPIPRDEPIVTRLEWAIRGTILSEDVIIQTSE